jgi:hypothetical protein
VGGDRRILTPASDLLLRFTKLAAEDPDVHRLTAEVQHLLKPRSVYRDPALLQRVLPLLLQS